ncbi:DUF1048 domain-containing protein [Lacticaseibacillus suihuaensis]
MNFWDRITGNDMTRQMAAFAARVALLPSDYQAAWQTINQTVMARADFTGRNLMPILAGIVDMMVEAAADGLSVQEALGDDIAGFADSVGAASGATNVQDRWRRQLNAAVYKKLGRRQP